MNLPEVLPSLILARHGLENLKVMMAVLEMELRAVLEMELMAELMLRMILPVQKLKKN